MTSPPAGENNSIPLRIAAECDGHQWRIVVRGSIASPSAQTLAALLVSCVRNARMLTLDLSEVGTVSPACLHLLVSVRRMARAHGCAFSISALSPTAEATMSAKGLAHWGERVRVATPAETAMCGG
jgi:anti-anti-sigma regulatory factor